MFYDVNLLFGQVKAVVVLGPSGLWQPPCSVVSICLRLLSAGHTLIEDQEIMGTNEAEVNALRRDVGIFSNSSIVWSFDRQRERNDWPD